MAATPNIGEKKVKAALKKTLLKSKLTNIAELFSEGQRENFSIFLIDRLFDLFKTDHPDYSNTNGTSEYVVDMNVIFFFKISIFFKKKILKIEIFTCFTQFFP